MRFVVKDPLTITDNLASEETKNAINTIAITRDKEAISVAIYRESYPTPEGIQSRVGDALALTYHNKCGYCERRAKVDIEHYRPKKKVSEDKNHEGYYWLCYEWTNLLPACITCNREGAKHSKFPVLGPRIYEPTFLEDDNLDFQTCSAYTSPLLDEVAGLLHPEIDEPEQFFKFQPFNDDLGVSLVPLSNTGIANQRAMLTIEICKLNREELRLDRLGIIQDLINAFEAILVRYRDDLDVAIDRSMDLFFEISRKSIDEKSTHTLFRKFIISSTDNFEYIVTHFCTNEKVKKILSSAFISWYKSN